MLKEVFVKYAPPSTVQFVRQQYVSCKTAWTSKLEPEMEIVASLVRPSYTVFDIGANVGTYTAFLSRHLGAHGRVVAFEPVADTFSVLFKTISRLPLKNVEAHRIAIGAAAGSLQMTVPSGLTGYYFATVGEGQGRKESVQAYSLDGFCSAFCALPDFIKCDVEGYELNVLRGAVEVLKHRPAWLMEVSRDTSGDVFDLMHAAGYGVHVLGPRQTKRLTLVETSTYLDRQFSNYFFLPRT